MFIKRRFVVASDSKKTVGTKSATPARSPSAAIGVKPAARPRTAKAAAPAAAKPARKRVQQAAKATATAAKKTIARPLAKISPPAKKPAHEPEPFVAKENKADKPAKAKKAKLIRDSFTMPDGEYALIATLKKRCLDAGVSAKKSEILRAAVDSSSGVESRTVCVCVSVCVLFPFPDAVSPAAHFITMDSSARCCFAVRTDKRA